MDVWTRITAGCCNIWWFVVVKSFVIWCVVNVHIVVPVSLVCYWDYCTVEILLTLEYALSNCQVNRAIKMGQNFDHQTKKCKNCFWPLRKIIWFTLNENNHCKGWALMCPALLVSVRRRTEVWFSAECLSVWSLSYFAGLTRLSYSYEHMHIGIWFIW